MQRRIARILVLVTLVSTIAGMAVSGSAKPAAPQMYIVSLAQGVNPAAAAHASGGEVHYVYRDALNGYAAMLTPAAAAALTRNPQVLSVIADQPMSIQAQTVPTGIDRIDGDLSSTVSGNGSGAVDVDVAIIDTGIDTRHPDLNVVGGVNCSSGWSYNDGHGHGSHVAGTVGAKDDGIGVVGVAPGARLWAVRVLNNAGSGSWASVICGVDWVTAHASTIEVANMSLGGSGSEGSCTDGGLHQAICAAVKAGVTVVVAAGNSGVDAAGAVPASYDEVITVSALADFNGQPGGGASPTCRDDQDDTLADFSNYGADVDIIAPGVCIYSTYKKGGYTTFSGTSMASPHVAGAAALYKASNPGASPAQVKNALTSAGNFGWSGDRDGTQEPLLNVDAF